MWLATEQEVERHQDRAGEVRSRMSSERCVALSWATDLAFRSPGATHSHAPDGPFSILAHQSYHLGWSVLVLTQVPSLPALCLPQGELPQTDAEVPAGKAAKQREAGTASLVPSSCSTLSWMRPAGIYLQRVPGGGLDNPTRLYVFPPKKTPL